MQKDRALGPRVIPVGSAAGPAAPAPASTGTNVETTIRNKSPEAVRGNTLPSAQGDVWDFGILVHNVVAPLSFIDLKSKSSPRSQPAPIIQSNTITALEGGHLRVERFQVGHALASGCFVVDCGTVPSGKVTAPRSAKSTSAETESCEKATAVEMPLWAPADNFMLLYFCRFKLTNPVEVHLSVGRTHLTSHYCVIQPKVVAISEVMTSGGRQRGWVVEVSRVVWDWVLVPWVIPQSHRGLMFLPHRNNIAPEREGLGPDYFLLARLKDKYAVALLRVAEAMFPLAGPVCRAIMRAREASRRRFLRCCGEAQAPSCCRWFLAHFPHGPPIVSGPVPTPSPQQCQEGQGEWRRQGWGKECMAVLTGLCAGGHLDSARGFVDEGAPWGSLLWPRSRSIVVGTCDPPPTATATATRSGCGRGFVFYPLPTCYHEYDNDGGSGGDFPVAGRLESEFWGHKGIPALLDIVAERGHLDTLKWAFSRFGGTDESWFLLKRLLYAADEFQVDTVVWLANTINAAERLASQMVSWWWGVPRRASDIRRLMEMFPEWPLDASNMAWSAVNCKGPADEIISVCTWLTEWLPSEEMDFTDSRNCEVVKWALEGVNSSLLEPRLGSILQNVDDVQFAQWLLKRATPTESDFKSVCTHRKDNADIAKLVCEKLPLRSKDLLDAIHIALANGNTRIAQLLEDLLIAITSMDQRSTGNMQGS
ncbi:hypothetical protein Pelo_5437 [Pelomyxa schiedti]|nr:hypothetical protein Pelo_5437 [Pelomyxa schiedti]